LYVEKFPESPATKALKEIANKISTKD